MMEQPAVGCGLGANLLAHQPDLEKAADCCDAPGTRRTWRQWARRNDCCFANQNCAGAILCSPYTAVKWIVVGIFTIPLFWIHFGMGLSRFFFGGAFHMVCRVLCHNKNSTGLTVCYHVVAGVPLLINYLIALSEMLIILSFLFLTFVVALSASVFNPLCAVEACVELVVISDGIYKNIFANLPIALEHPGKLVAPCYFGFAYKSMGSPWTGGKSPFASSKVPPWTGSSDGLVAQHGAAQPAASGLQMQPHGGAGQPANVAPQAAVPLVQGMAVGVPVADTAGSSSHDAAGSSTLKGERSSCDKAGSSHDKAPPPYGA